MKIVNEPLLRQFRSRPCELCGHQPPNEPHHVIRKGIGGGSQIDHPLNLLTVCRWHHEWIHRGMQPPDVRVPTARDLWRIVAKREGVEIDTVEAVMFCVKRLPRDARPHHLDAALEGCDEAVKRLVHDALKGRAK